MYCVAYTRVKIWQTELLRVCFFGVAEPNQRSNLVKSDSTANMLASTMMCTLDPCTFRANKSGETSIWQPTLEMQNEVIVCNTLVLG